MLCIVVHTAMGFLFHGPLACVIHYMICFILPPKFHFPHTTPICFFFKTHTHKAPIFSVRPLLSNSTTHLLAIEQYACRATSHLAPHLFAPLSLSLSFRIAPLPDSF